MRILALFVVLALAGCLAEDDAAEPQDPVMDEPMDGNVTADYQVFTGSGTIAAGAGTPVGSAQQGGASVPFSVREGATLVFAEVTWDNDAMDLDLHLKEPGSEDTNWQHANDGGSAGSPDKPHNITLTMSDAGTWEGEWESTVFPKGAAGQTSYTIAVTVFYGETEVPAGYTAL